MSDDDINDQPESWADVGEQMAAGLAKHLTLDAVSDAGVNMLVKFIPAVVKLLDALAIPIAEVGGKILVELEEPVLPIMAAFVAPIVANLFGTEAGTELFSQRGNREGRRGAAGDIVDAYMKALAGDGDGELAASDEGAKRIASAGVHAALEGWFNELIPEILGEMIPVDWLHLPAFTGLSEEIINSLGIGRLVRRAMAPLVDATAATPMKRYANTKYRPNLLNEGAIISAFIAGDYSAQEARSELAQLGYSDRRQDVMLKHATKWLSAPDALVLLRDGQYDRTFAIENLRAQGYDQVGAEQALLVEEIKHLNTIRDDSAAAIKAAYVDRRISDGQLETYLFAVYPNDEDRSGYITAWRTVRDLNTKRLSPAQAETCVLAKVLPIAAYREALQLDGYDEEAVLSLELLLEVKLNAAADIETLRIKKAAEAAAAKLAAEEAARKRAAELAAERALARRGSLASLQRAVVRGLIPTSRYAEVLTPQYDGDTVATMIALVERDRADYLAQLQKAADAAKRAAVRHIDVGALETAYLDNILTLDQVRAQLDALTFDPDDAAILTATMRARKTDLDAAKRDRADAAAKAKIKSIDLSRLETLVRRGHRTMADYTDLLASLGFDAGSVAAMVDLLQLQIADDQAARDARAAAAAAAATTGLTLEQIRRAVILKLQSVDDFANYLSKHKYALDAQAVLVAELRADVTEAEAARAKRAAAERAAVDTHAPLSTIARAARLGIITPDVYAARLADVGYTDDDIALELDLLAVEIADVQAARAKAAAAEAKAADPSLSLETIARAVKLGVASMDAYRTRAIEIGYSDDEIATLVALLDQDVQQVQDAEARRAAIDAQLHQRNLSIGQLEEAVKAGQMTLDQYHARLLALTFGADDADLLTTLLALKLAAAPGPGGAS